MKILFVTPYITSCKHPAFMRNKTGLGMMVNDIASKVGKTENVDLFAVNCIAPSLQMSDYKTLGRSWMTMIFGFNMNSLIDGIKFIRRYEVPFKEKLRTIYQHLSVGVLSSIISEYDIVHIHGCGAFTNEAIKLCQRKNVPFCVTLHGLVSFEEAVRLYPALKKYEKDFLVEAYENNYSVSFISTGNYEQAIDYVTSQVSK